jgi:uncharacterized protein YbgA (DUF1722 family)
MAIVETIDRTTTKCWKGWLVDTRIRNSLLLMVEDPARGVRNIGEIIAGIKEQSLHDLTQETGW